jgi:hypothetical protein
MAWGPVGVVQLIQPFVRRVVQDNSVCFGFPLYCVSVVLSKLLVARTSIKGKAPFFSVSIIKITLRRIPFGCLRKLRNDFLLCGHTTREVTVVNEMLAAA